MEYSKNHIMIAIAIALIPIVSGILIYQYVYKPKKNQELNAKTFVKNGIVYVHDTVYVDLSDKKVEKPIPSITKYKVTDWVCAWGKWSGVIREISWSERAENTLVYTVQHYDEEEGWYENQYVETELEAGKCN